MNIANKCESQGFWNIPLTIPGVSIISFFFLFTIIQHPLTLIHFHFPCVCLVWPPYNTHITSENSFLSPSPFFMSYEKKVSFLSHPSIHYLSLWKNRRKKNNNKKEITEPFPCWSRTVYMGLLPILYTLLIADNYSSLIPEVGCLCWLL